MAELIGTLQRTPGYRRAALQLLETLMSRDIWDVHLLVDDLEREKPPGTLE